MTCTLKALVLTLIIFGSSVTFMAAGAMPVQACTGGCNNR